MPRQSNSNRTSSQTSTKPPTILPPPKIWHQAPQIWKSSEDSRPSMLQTMKEGVGLGMGSAIGHRIVGGIFGPSYPPQAQYLPPAPLNPPLTREYAQCILMNEKNQDVCRPFISNDKSPWKTCMEMNAYDGELCKDTQ